MCRLHLGRANATSPYRISSPLSPSPALTAGTWTASIVAGAHSGGHGTRGVAPEARLVLIKVLSDVAFGTDEPIIAGIKCVRATLAAFGILSQCSCGSLLLRLRRYQDMAQIWNDVAAEDWHPYASGSLVSHCRFVSFRWVSLMPAGSAMSIRQSPQRHCLWVLSSVCRPLLLLCFY